MEQCKISNLYDLNETIAADYLRTAEYPWELLDGLSDYVKRLGQRWIRRSMSSGGSMSGWRRALRLPLPHIWEAR